MLRLPTLCLVAAVVGCSTGSADAPAAIELQAFGSQYVAVDTLRLAQSDSQPIVYVSGVAVTEDQRVILSDPGERSVRMYGADGTLLRVLGRQGSGPGEFRLPLAPRIGPGGTIHVLDAGLRKVVVFDADGALLRDVYLPPDMVRVDELGVLGDGSYAMVGAVEASDHVLILADPSGKRRHTALPLRDAIPAGEQDAEAWQYARRPSVATRGMEAFVVTTLLDSLWQVSAPAGDVTAAHLAMPGYAPPSLPDDGIPNDSVLRAWNRSYWVAVTILASDSLVAVPFARGLYNEGAESVLLTRRPHEAWRAASGAPPLVGLFGHDLIAIGNAGHGSLEPLVLVRYRSQP